MEMAATRVTDVHACTVTPSGPIIPPCCTTVITGGFYQARGTDLATCVAPPGTAIAMGSSTVYIGGMLAARQGDPTACGVAITLGLSTVRIGQAPGLSPGGPAFSSWNWGVTID